MKLLVDMNISPRWVDHLAAAGFDAVHWLTQGRVDATDAEIMSYARKHGCIVLTQDLDFSAILAATGGDKPSVAQIRADDLGFDTIGKPVIDALRQMQTELERGALLTIEPGRTRIRLLPLAF